MVNGTASFNQAGNLLTVNNTNGTIINWNSFSIGANETTRFNQASASSSVLNRVIANDPSVLLGTLSSNGHVWLVNPAGIMVGQGATIDVAGFVASTLNVANQDFLAGRLNFGATPNAGSIQNYGQITTSSGGSVYLVAPSVTNNGIINAPNGEVILVAGQTVQLLDTGTPGVSVAITGAQGNATNLGQIISEAGRIGMAGVLVKNSGTLDASSVVKEGGAHFPQGEPGRLRRRRRAHRRHRHQGRQHRSARQTRRGDGSGELEASGDAGGGTVLVGGDAHGANPASERHDTYVGPNASIKRGRNAERRWRHGHRVGRRLHAVLRRDLRARGGAQSGNGGFVETSGATLKASGTVNTSAPYSAQSEVGYLIRTISISSTVIRRQQHDVHDRSQRRQRIQR